MVRLAVLSLALATSLLQLSTRSDLVVINVLKRLDRSVTDAIVWHRVTLTGEMDLVLAVGRPSAVGFYDVSDGWFGWDSRAKLGFFLQERSRPERAYVLAIEPGGSECDAHILRATATDTVISCGGEKSEIYPNQKFVYDVRAKRLVSRFAYEPFSMSRLKLKKGGTGAVIVGSDGTVQVQVDFQPDRVPEFKVIASVKEATVSEWPRHQHHGLFSDRRLLPARFGPSGTFTLIQIQKDVTDEPELVVQEMVGRRRRSYRLPPSNHEAFVRARPGQIPQSYTPGRATFEDRIGPWQNEGGTLWFGKTFYDGEGITGIGGFGYFDAEERKYRVFTSSVIADWSVSAIYVQPKAVWLALVSRSEYGGPGGGVVRFDRQSGSYQRFETGDSIGHEFVSVGDRLLMASHNGITVFHNDQAKHYIVDRTTDGRLRVVPAEK